MSQDVSLTTFQLLESLEHSGTIESLARAAGAGANAPDGFPTVMVWYTMGIRSDLMGIYR